MDAGRTKIAQGKSVAQYNVATGSCRNTNGLTASQQAVIALYHGHTVHKVTSFARRVSQGIGWIRAANQAFQEPGPREPVVFLQFDPKGNVSMTERLAP